MFTDAVIMTVATARVYLSNMRFSA